MSPSGRRVTGVTAHGVPFGEGLDRADVDEPSHAAASARSRPGLEAELTLEQKRVRRLLAQGCDPLAGSRILAVRFARKQEEAA